MTSGGGPQLWWPRYAWILAGVEVLVVLWFHVSRVPVESSLDGYFWQFAVLFGSAGQHIGAFPVIHAVNTLVVVGLWVSYRSRRRFQKSLNSPASLAPLLAAVLFATIGWWGLRMQVQYRPVETRAVYTLEPDGMYSLTVLDAR